MFMLIRQGAMSLSSQIDNHIELNGRFAAPQFEKKTQGASEHGSTDEKFSVAAQQTVGITICF